MTGIDIHPVCESIKAMIDLFEEAPTYFVRIFDSWFDICTSMMITITDVVDGVPFVDYLMDLRSQVKPDDFFVPDLVSVNKWLHCLLHMEMVLENHADQISVPAVSNIMLYRCDDNSLKLLFDPIHMSLSSVSTSLDSLRYVAPEVVSQNQGNSKSSIYSIGICLIEMLTYTRAYSECTTLSDLINKKKNVSSLVVFSVADSSRLAPRYIEYQVPSSSRAVHGSCGGTSVAGRAASGAVARRLLARDTPTELSPGDAFGDGGAVQRALCEFATRQRTRVRSGEHASGGFLQGEVGRMISHS